MGINKRSTTSDELAPSKPQAGTVLDFRARAGKSRLYSNRETDTHGTYGELPIPANMGTKEYGRLSGKGKFVETDLLIGSEDETDAMSISREELDAKLNSNKAELEAIAARVQRDMAEWREQQNHQMSLLSSAISNISSKIDGKLDSVDGDVKAINGHFAGIQGQITGINTAISGIQSGISSRLVIFGVIIAVLVAVPGLFSAFKDSPQPPPVSPIIIQVPQASPHISEVQPNIPSTSKTSH